MVIDRYLPILNDNSHKNFLANLSEEETEISQQEHKMLNKAEFKILIESLQGPVFSKTGKASYSGFSIRDSMLHFTRENKKTRWFISTEDLYNAYLNLDYIDTQNIKEYVKGLVYSPACAVLIALGLYDSKGLRKT